MGTDEAPQVDHLGDSFPFTFTIFLVRLEASRTVVGYIWLEVACPQTVRVEVCFDKTVQPRGCSGAMFRTIITTINRYEYLRTIFRFWQAKRRWSALTRQIFFLLMTSLWKYSPPPRLKFRIVEHNMALFHTGKNGHPAPYAFLLCVCTAFTRLGVTHCARKHSTFKMLGLMNRPSVAGIDCFYNAYVETNELNSMNSGFQIWILSKTTPPPLLPCMLSGNYNYCFDFTRSVLGVTASLCPPSLRSTCAR